MNILSWVLFGLIVGIVTNTLDPQPYRGGLFRSICVGVTGALFGGFMANIIFGKQITIFDPTSFSVAVFGSLLILTVGKTLRRV